ncbi:terminase family protein [Buttiauxella sp. WJP83]|uniref:terminase large subunit domain-containing protein n=1 Tax=Buttiauxella sp. WJP83 TaxID=2986951 RepID=UPI0022DE39FA|nr:terminase family protein [Buttiauxella sp. WJP83]WBM71935.1 terminase family protein [Buttiauxella sp. WJP83]
MIDLSTLSDEELLDLLTELKQTQQRVKAFQKYNRIEYFDPFPYQRKFMAAGKEHNIRYLRAGNRCGKTFGAANEFAMHLTGRYPDWWQGLVVPDGGHTYWCVGVTLDSVRRVLQKELLGTENAKILEEIGSGALPRDCLDLDSISRDGNAVKSICVRHKDGSINTLNFYGSQNEAVMMGQKVRGCMFDEEPEHRSLEIYSQIKTRLLNAGGNGVDGFLIFTATPEQG